MKRTERHQLKQDEFVAGLERATLWFTDNRKNVVNALLVLAGGTLLLGGLYIHRDRQSRAARDLLDEALRQFHGDVGSGGESVPGQVSFATSEEKYRAALASFQTLAETYSGYDAGRQGRYYEGLCHLELAELDSAVEALSKLRSGKRDLLYYLSSRTLAGIMSVTGDYSGATGLYRSLLDDAENPLPKDELLFELARLEERAGNLAEARSLFQRLLTEHPDSQFRGDAQTRLDVLEFQTRSGTAG